jgi:hypothetical protein
MERIRKELLEFVDRARLVRRDRRNSIILLAFGLPMFVASLYAFLTASNLVPQMWSELPVVVVLGLLYNLAVRKESIDLRLGIVYTAVGILLSFPVLLVGFFGCALTAVTFPFLEDTIWSPLRLLPFFLAALIVFRFVGSMGKKVAENQWRSVLRTELESEQEDADPRAIYLGEAEWTDSWFYVFLFFTVELVPLLLQHEASFRFLIDSLLAIGALTFFLGRGYYILRREQKLLALRL